MTGADKIMAGSLVVILGTSIFTLSDCGRSLPKAPPVQPPAASTLQSALTNSTLADSAARHTAENRDAQIRDHYTAQVMALPEANSGIDPGVDRAWRSAIAGLRQSGPGQGSDGDLGVAVQPQQGAGAGAVSTHIMPSGSGAAPSDQSPSPPPGTDDSGDDDDVLDCPGSSRQRCRTPA